MSKKKKEVCPYCNQEFIYLSRHKCKVKMRIESEDEETEQERRQVHLEFIRKELARKLKKDENEVLEIIKREGDLTLNDLQNKIKISSDKLEDILEVLNLKLKIKIQRELKTANWTKHIYYIEEINETPIKTSEKLDKKKDDFVWDMIWRVPCFLCPFIDRCDTEQIKFNPYICKWFTDWIWHRLDNKNYLNPFEGIEEDFLEEQF